MENQISFGKLFFEIREFEKKIEFYLLGVIITLLSLSIQTFKLEDNIKFEFLMVIVWVLLLLSLFFGFQRIEKLRQLYHFEADRLYKLEHEAHSVDSKVVQELIKAASRKNKEAIKYYKLMTRLFMTGIVVFILFKVINMYY